MKRGKLEVVDYFRVAVLFCLIMLGLAYFGYYFEEFNKLIENSLE